MRQRGTASTATIDLTLSHWQDTGCPDLGIPRCVSCPLPACRYELRPKVARSLARLAELRPLIAAGMTTAAAAAHMGLSIRQIARLRAQL